MIKKLSLKDRLVFALDVPAVKVQEMLSIFGSKVGWIKANRAFLAGGVTLMKQIAATGAKPFLDLKWHDIPETVEGYVEEAVTSMKLGMFDVHALGGYEMMARCRHYLNKKFKDNPKEKPLLIAITVLTSLEQRHLVSMGFKYTEPKELSTVLARQAIDAGCDGVVTAATDVKMIREWIGEEPIIVTPAIRFADVTVANDDQKRMATPEAAIANGADILVMGRPLIQGGKDAVKMAYDGIAKGLELRQKM